MGIAPTVMTNSIKKNVCQKALVEVLTATYTKVLIARFLLCSA